MAQPTPIDTVNAMIYARKRFLKEACTRRQQETNGEVIWQPTPLNRSYPCPSGLEGCDDTCGYCKVASKDMCTALMKDAKGEKCVKGRCTTQGSTCKKDGYCYFKWPYLEYHNPSKGGEKPCSINKQCPQGQYCDEYNNLCRSSKGGKCVYGNFLLRNWCLNPESRNDKPTRGETNVYPFDYDENQGKCFISRPYCEWSMGVTFGKDSKGRPTCYEGAGQWLGEFFVGKTIFRAARYRAYNKWSKVINKESFQGSTGIMIGKDFGGPNVHLYLYETEVGFDPDEVREAYPNHVHGKLLRFTSDDLDKDPLKRRLYLFDRFYGFLNPFMISYISQIIKSDK